ESAPVEDDLGDARGPGPLGHEAADLGRGLLVAAGTTPQVGLDSAGGGQRAAGHVVDHLGGDVLVGPVDGQPRPLGGTPNGLAHAPVPALAALLLLLGG